MFFIPKLRVRDEQAYTNELENKVSRLEEENERLRKRKVCGISSKILFPSDIIQTASFILFFLLLVFWLISITDMHYDSMLDLFKREIAVALANLADILSNQVLSV